MLHSKVCKGCNEEFLTETKRRKYCSSECYHSHQKPTVAIVIKCIQCSKEFYVTPKRIELGRGKYCSKECKAIATNFLATCECCGKTYSLYKCRVGRKYCSSECGRKSMFKSIGGVNHYAYRCAHANSYRREAFAIHGDKCEKCGSDIKVQVHHKDHNRKNNPLDGSNWLVLCRKCHFSYHGEKRSENALGTLKQCPYCGIIFKSPNKNIIHCSRTCATKHVHLRRRNLKKA